MKYIGIKTVDAVPMTAEEAVEHGYRIGDNNGDGYEVTYEEGYKSWCPKEVFEKHNHMLNRVFVQTVLPMIDGDWKERFLAEYFQTYTRYKLLKAAIEDGTINTIHTPLSIYQQQIAILENYINILEQRAELEGINLDYDKFKKDHNYNYSYNEKTI